MEKSLQQNPQNVQDKSRMRAILFTSNYVFRGK